MASARLMIHFTLPKRSQPLPTRILARKLSTLCPVTIGVPAPAPAMVPILPLVHPRRARVSSLLSQRAPCALDISLVEPMGASSLLWPRFLLRIQQLRRLRRAQFSSPSTFLSSRSLDHILTAYSLLKTATDDRLAEDIVRVFGEYGAVDVKVRRDSREMPFAFVQYTVSVRRLDEDIADISFSVSKMPLVQFSLAIPV